MAQYSSYLKKSSGHCLSQHYVLALTGLGRSKPQKQTEHCSSLSRVHGFKPWTVGLETQALGEIIGLYHSLSWPNVDSSVKMSRSSLLLIYKLKAGAILESDTKTNWHCLNHCLFCWIHILLR